MILVKDNFIYPESYVKAKPNKVFSEVDVEGQPVDSNEDNTDYTNPNDMQPMNPTGNEGDQPTEDNQPQDGDEPAEGQEEDPEDFTADAGPDAGGEEGDPDAEGDTPPDEGGEGSSGADGDQVQADDARGMEQEIFKDLTPDQLDLKHKELKSNFTTLYDTTSNLIDRVNDIPTSEEFTTTISFINEKLSDLRQMVTDYVNNVYSTKSYMENVINYNKFLAILKGINDILEEVNRDLSKEGDK